MAEEELPQDPGNDDSALSDEDLEPIDLTPMWLRKFTWDALPCRDAQEMHKKLGLVPTDDESAELEHVESHARMHMVSHIEPAVDTFSDVVSKVLSTYLIDRASDGVKSELTDALTDKLFSQNSELIRIGSLSIIAALIDTGVLGYTEKIFNKIKEQQGDHDEQ